MPDKQKTRTVTLVRSAYQPSAVEIDELVEFPEEVTPKDLARAVTHPSKIKWTDRPE